MGSSSYHHSRYVYYRGEQAKFEGWLRQLNAINSGFRSGGVTGGSDDVNKQVERCSSQMEEGIRNDSICYNNAQDVKDAREAYVTNDADLSRAISGIQSEITRITGKKNTACSNKNTQYRLYLEALAREAAALG